jgi:cobaltochelatase CobN
MRTSGEDIAEALYLMGVKPVRQQGNLRVSGLEIIPTRDLKFPRIDVTFRTSGFFRDSFPNLMNLLDEAVIMVAALNEPQEKNYLRRNIELEKQELLKQGIDPEQAKKQATFRVFSDPPGTYGTGVPELIDSQAWKTTEDLGNMFISRGSYAYGKDHYGVQTEQGFRNRLGAMQIVLKNEDSREYDLLSSDDFNAYFGGFAAAVKTVSGIAPFSYAGDASDPKRLKYRELEKEVKHIYRSRILNPKWIEGMKRHGYKGAGDLSRTVDISFHWDATTQVIDDWMYEQLACKYALNKEMQEWFKKVNPHALQNITERLLEAIAREQWQAPDDTKEQLENLYLNIEGDIEDRI